MADTMTECAGGDDDAGASLLCRRWRCVRPSKWRVGDGVVRAGVGGDDSAATAAESRKRPLEPSSPTSEPSAAAKTAKPNDQDEALAQAGPVAEGGDNNKEAGDAAVGVKGGEEGDRAKGAAGEGDATAAAAATEPQPAGDAAEAAATEASPEFTQPSSYALKVLVSNNSAGSIIGKRGSTINMMQQQSQATIKVRYLARQRFTPASEQVGR
jgi:hypothetical protein